MKKIFIGLLASFMFLGSMLYCKCSFSQIASSSLPAWVSKVGSFYRPVSGHVYHVRDFGIVPSDTSQKATRFIQAAIDQCSKNGGGKVILDPGLYLSGALFLKSGVDFEISEGAILLASTDLRDYPEMKSRIAGIEMTWPCALINIIGQKRVTLSGKGLVNARGKYCWDKYWNMRKQYDAKGLRWIVDYDAQRVRTVLVQHDTDIVIRDLQFRNSGFWTIQLLYSSHISVIGVNINNNVDGKGPSTDGIDVDSSSWVLIDGCDVDCNDDNYCLKSGRDWDGLRVNIPTQYVVVRHCIARRGGGVLTLGSETSGFIRHVWAYDLKAIGTSNGLHIKSAINRGGGVSDIHFSNIHMDHVRNAFLFTMNWNPSYSYATLPAGYDIKNIPEHWKTMLQKVAPPEKGIPDFSQVSVCHVTGQAIGRIFLAEGISGHPLNAFHFKDITLSADKIGSISFARNWTFREVKLKGQDAMDHLEISNSSSVDF